MGNDPDALIESLREMWLTDSNLDFLRELDPSHLARVHAEVKGHLERTRAAEARMYEVMAKTTKFVPNFMVHRLGAHLSPHVLAGVTEHMDPKTAAGLSKGFEPELLGEIALYLSTTTTAEVTRHSDIDHVLRVIERMADKRLHHRLGELGDALDAKTLEKLVQRLVRVEHIAAVAGHMTDREKLGRVARTMKPSLRAEVESALRRDGRGEVADAIARA